MAGYEIKLPDIGEGVTEAELVEWTVSVGDRVREDQTLASVMTDKAAVEIPSPADGIIAELCAELGDVVAVGSVLIRIDADGNSEPIDAVSGNNPQETAPISDAEVDPPLPPTGRADHRNKASEQRPKTNRDRELAQGTEPRFGASGDESVSDRRPLASPSVRRRARDAGVDLRHVPGSGPAGRIEHEDLDNYLSGGNNGSARGARRANKQVDEIKVIGMRRQIAQRMQLAKRRIPHFSYVEEVDVTSLMVLRAELNRSRNDAQPKLSILPFVVKALTRAIADFPQMNARFDDDNDVVHRYGGAHVGIATQTENGLLVPVVRHAEILDVWEIATEIRRLADVARDGTANRDELSNSTITVTSLGRLGGIATTPVINYPEVAIIGVNKIQTRPMWLDDGVVPRQMMNLSSSFDHRVVDGWDAAEFIQHIRSMLEHPTLMFMEEA